MRSFPDECVQTVVTSPPYWNLRDYGVAGQMGLEKSPDAFISRMIQVFREVRRILRKDGTLWLNMGDSYNNDRTGGHGATGGLESSTLVSPGHIGQCLTKKSIDKKLKPKDLIGMPWRIAFALQASGWYLRSDIIWSKPNPMPESVMDRPTKAHEYLFLMAKSERYFYDAAAIKEVATYGQANSPDSIKSPYGQGFTRSAAKKRVPAGWDTSHESNGKVGRYKKQRGHARPQTGLDDEPKEIQCSGMRNKRSVWTVATSPFSEAHFATFPLDLIKPCILAGCPPGGVVFDPFMGAGTTALAALQLGRHFLGVELNPAYVAMAEKRIAHERAQIKMNF